MSYDECVKAINIGIEKRRLAVACMLAMNNPVIILDEPYANLDYSGVRQVNQPE